MEKKGKYKKSRYRHGCLMHKQLNLEDFKSIPHFQIVTYKKYSNHFLKSCIKHILKYIRAGAVMWRL